MKINDVLNENKELSKSEIEYGADLIMNSEFYKNNRNTILKNANFNLYHNTNVDHGNISHFDVKDREKPRDSHRVIHNITNELSKEQFGVEIRNKLFATLSESQAKVYGKNRYIIFPIGQYQLYFSKTVEDFYGEDHRILKYNSLTSKIHDYVYKSVINNNYEELERLTELLNFNFSDYMKNVKDQYFNEILQHFQVDIYYGILNDDEESYYNLARFVSLKFNEKLFEQIIDVDNYISNEDGSGDNSVFRILESLIRKIMIRNKDDIVSIIDKHFRECIQSNYIDTIEKTKYISELEKFSESIIDSESVLFLSNTAKSQILSEILRKESNEN